MSIKKYNEYLNEKVEQYDFGFTTVIQSKDVDFYYFPSEEDQTVTTGDLTLEWEMDFDNRKYGINSIAPVIKKITGHFMVIKDEHEDEKEFNVDPNEEAGWDITCEIGNDFTFGSALVPRTLEADFKANKITVYF